MRNTCAEKRVSCGHFLMNLLLLYLGSLNLTRVVRCMCRNICSCFLPLTNFILNYRHFCKTVQTMVVLPLDGSFLLKPPEGLPEGLAQAAAPMKGLGQLGELWGGEPCFGML